MPPRRRERREKQSTTADSSVTDALTNTFPKIEKPQESDFKRLFRKTAFRLTIIVIFIFVTRRLNNDVKQFHTKIIPWKVRDFPGRGKGMVATRLIKQGERIITERPLFIVPKQITGNPVDFINSRLKSLSEEQQAAFLELSYVDSGSNISRENIPLSIFQTNAISAGDSGVGIFPKTARLNHACSAGFNSVYTWREKENLLVVHALKEIQIGEELLTTYLNTKLPRDGRRSYLAQMYKFNCSCQTWETQELSGLEALNLVRKIWRTGEVEGYWSERGQLAADAAHIAAAHSDEYATRKWATLARQWYSHELGVDSEQVDRMHPIIADPRQHPMWGSRNYMEVGDLSY